MKKTLTYTIILLAISFLLFKCCKGCEFLTARDTGKVRLVKEDNHLWGSGEYPSLIYSVVKCSDMSIEEGVQYVDKYYFDKDYMSEINLDSFNAGMLGLSYEGVFQCLFEIPVE